MITFCIVIYTLIMLCMTFKYLLNRGDGPEGALAQLFGVPVFTILFVIGVVAFCKLYNIHLVVLG